MTGAESGVPGSSVWDNVQDADPADDPKRDYDDSPSPGSRDCTHRTSKLAGTGMDIFAVIAAKAIGAITIATVKIIHAASLAGVGLVG